MTTSRPSTSAESGSAESGPAERQRLLEAALAVIREDGAPGLRVDDVLSRAGLGTRAFYRHFESKDRLVLEVFAAAARAEAERLRQRMPRDPDPVAGVTAWIDGRLDLAFDAGVQSDLQFVSRQAQALNAVSPETMSAVHGAMLAPLIEQIEHGVEAGVFAGVDPVAAALNIDAVTWARIERQWALGSTGQRAVQRETQRGDRREARAQVLGFCLRGLAAE